MFANYLMPADAPSIYLYVVYGFSLTNWLCLI